MVVAYNSGEYLEACLRSLLGQTYPSYEVVLVDNGSADGGPEAAARDHPEVRLVRSPTNRHYTGGNNLGFRVARGELLASVNVDTEVAPEWLQALVDAMDRYPDAGLATSRVCLLNERDRINACGNDVHVSGLGFCRGLGRRADAYPDVTDVPSVSGAAFMTRRAVIEEIGDFDEDFVAYVEDTDLSMRAALAGYRVLYVPGSVVFHDYALRMRPEKFLQLERNRLQPLFKVLRRRTVLALAPALVVAEIMTLAFAVKGGPAYLRMKARAWRYLLEHRRQASAKHAAAQAHRRVNDGVLLRRLSSRIPADQLGLPPALARIAAPALSAAFAVAMAPARLLIR